MWFTNGWRRGGNGKTGLRWNWWWQGCGVRHDKFRLAGWTIELLAAPGFVRCDVLTTV
jgi:hypothetical protein